MRARLLGLLLVLGAATLEAQVAVDCNAPARGWVGVTLAEQPKSYSWWQSGGVCNLAMRGVTAQYADHRALVLIPGTEGARSVDAVVRFNADPLRLRKGTFDYYRDCNLKCSSQQPQNAPDSGWCLVVAADPFGPSRLMACATAPNGVEGGPLEWADACDANEPHDLASLLMLVYVDQVGTRHYAGAQMIPALPLEGVGPDSWITLSASAIDVGGQIAARLDVSYTTLDGPESHSTTGTFVGSLSPTGLAGVQPSMMPQTFCTGYFGRPIRSLGLDELVVR